MSSTNFLEMLLDSVAVEWKALGSVTTIKTGQSVNKQMISANPGDYPVINSGREPLGFINEWNTDNDPIGITTRGAGVGSITWQEGKYFRGNLNYSVTINGSQKISKRYLYHLLLEMQSDIQALCTFDGIPALNAGNLKEKFDAIVFVDGAIPAMVEGPASPYEEKEPSLDEIPAAFHAMGDT